MMRRLGPDARVAIVLLAASAFFLVHLLATPASGGGFVSTTTLPTAVAAAMTLLAVLLLGWSVARPAKTAASLEGAPAHGGRWRVPALIGWTALDIALMPYFGYLATTAVYIAGLALLFGSRRPLIIIPVAVLVPVALLLFFERFMIVLLPSARLFQ